MQELGYLSILALWVGVIVHQPDTVLFDNSEWNRIIFRDIGGVLAGASVPGIFDIGGLCHNSIRLNL